MMFVFHFRLRKTILAAATAVVLLAIALCILLPGCREKNEPVLLSSEEARLSYLADLGWAVRDTPVETLDLQLPQTWSGEWESYIQLQNEQGLPFADFAACQVRRYTYAVTNYPEVTQGVQINLYLCEDQLIGGDLISTGEKAFQHGLAFPQR